MALKQLLVFVILIYSSVSFSQGYFSSDQSSQDSLRKAFNTFVKEVESHPIDTNHAAPKLTDNFQLIWVRHVSHSSPFYEKGDESQLKVDAFNLSERPDMNYSEIFYGDDYFVIWYSYNLAMSTIFNDVYYYKRKTVTVISDMFGKGRSVYGEPTGPSFAVVLYDSIIKNEIDSVLLIKYGNYVDSISNFTHKKSVDTTGIYRLKYYYGTSSGFDLYGSGNNNYTNLYEGNNLCITYSDLVKFKPKNGYPFIGIRSYNNGEVLMFNSFVSRHGGTFDIVRSQTYYFERVE